jgi:hypothetical protein
MPYGELEDFMYCECKPMITAFHKAELLPRMSIEEICRGSDVIKKHIHLRKDGVAISWNHPLDKPIRRLAIWRQVGRKSEMCTYGVGYSAYVEC